MYEEQDLLYRCTDRTRTVVQLAAALSRKLGHSDVQAQDILNALLHYQSAQWPGEWAETVVPKLPLTHILSIVDDATLKRSATLVRVIAEAKKEAISIGETYIDNDHLLLGLMRIYPEIVLDADSVRAALEAIYPSSKYTYLGRCDSLLFGTQRCKRWFARATPLHFALRRGGTRGIIGKNMQK